jgi:CelD/BcsL family acetyltransferase involved in cellulose biosynthesis
MSPLAAPGLTVRTFTSPVDVPSRDWAVLTARGPASIAGSREWVEAALGTVDRGATPHLLAFYEAERLVGLMPLALDELPLRPLLRFVASPFNDMSDLVALPGAEGVTAAAAIETLLQLAEHGYSVRLDDVDPDGALAQADPARDLLDWSGAAAAPVIDLHDRVAHPSLRQARRLRYALRRLRARHAVEFRRRDGAAMLEVLDDFVALRAARLRALRRDLADPPVPLLKAAVRRLAPSGRSAFVEMLVDGAVVARDLYLLDGRVAMLWLRALSMSWLRYSCGHLLLQAGADQLVAEGYETLDLGRGAEPYKFRSGAQPRVLLRATATIR